MDSSATSPSLRFLNLNGIPIGTPAEWTPALLEVEIDPAHWAEAELRIQDVPVPLMLRRLNGIPGIFAEWPRTGAGRYAIHARSADGEASLRITIPPSKLSETAFTTLLDDLQTRLPAAVAFRLQQLGALSGLTILPPAETTVAQEIVRLRRAVWGTNQRPGLARVLEGLADDPHRMLRTESLWVRREQARRPHVSDLVRAIAHPHLLSDDRLPTHLIDRRAEPTVDLFENRMVLLFANEVDIRLRRLSRHIGISESAQRASLVSDMRDSMRRARRVAQFLDDVTPVSYLPDRVTMVLLNRPLYRAALEGYLELHRSLATRLDDDRLEAPLENVPALYQLWGTLEIITELLSMANHLGYRAVSQSLVHRDATSAFVRIIPAGETVLYLQHPIHNREVRLIPERTFGRTSALRSQSYDQKPDITVEVRHPGGRPRLYLFDPKYKLAETPDDQNIATGRPSKVDIDKMHAYRDAIRDEQDRRVVISAATLYPGPSMRYGRGIEAIQANPDRTGDLRTRVSEILRDALEAPGPPIETSLER